MTRLLVATRSHGKEAEFRSLFAASPFEVVFPRELGLSESAGEAALERFDTFVENAAAKAHWFAALTGMAGLADDSGLEVDALGGGPGVRSRRFSGRDGPDTAVAGANNAALLAALRDVPLDRRTARYSCVLVLSRTGRDDLIATGRTEGRILDGPRGRGGFGYDPLFWSQDLGVTFGEAAPGAKDAVSHRGRAVAALLAAWQAGDC